jgi:exosome complex exonuclease DIS3/RRP44
MSSISSVDDDFRAVGTAEVVADASTRVMYHKLTRRGTRKVVQEHYLRDDIACGLIGCVICADGGLGTGASSWSAAVLAPAEPLRRVVVLDTNVVLHQLDALEAAGDLITDVVLPQTVLEETRHRSSVIYARVIALLRLPQRRFFAFANTHHRATYSQRLSGESANDYNDRLVRDAAAWLAQHFSEAAPGVMVRLITNDALSRAAAQQKGIDACTMREVIVGCGKPALLELLAASQDAEMNDSGVLKAGKPTLKAARAGTAQVFSAGGVSGPYKEHLSTATLEEGLRNGVFFQGVVRVNRDCESRAPFLFCARIPANLCLPYFPTPGWFEARVLIHNAIGKVGSDGQGRANGGDDALPVLLQGRESLNRAMDGDSVVIELLPVSAWRAPSTRLAGQTVLSGEDDEIERQALSAATAGIDGASSAESAATPREVIARAISNRSRTGAQPTARVVGILRRAWRPMCGSLEPPSEDYSTRTNDSHAAVEFALFVPWDTRYPRVRIETRQKAALMDKRIVVSIDGWDVNGKHPRGHYVRTIGLIGDKAAENEVIIFEHDIIARPFSSDVLGCLPPADWTIPPDAVTKGERTDLRHIDVCSIDPPGCKDIDDALHARVLPSSETGAREGDVIEVGVHIADVSYFVKHNTAIDIEASERANTTYLVERRLDMLPGLLTETLCSLKGGVDRFAFTVTWQFRRVSAEDPRCAPGGEFGRCAPGDMWEQIPGRTRFFKSIIHSRAAMTYAQAQDLLDDPKADTPVARGVKLLASIARCLRRLRIEAGALSLASPEVKFLLDSETHDPTDVSAYVTRETNSTVEEFMLLANCAVGERVTAAFPRCSLLRRHPSPPRSAFDALVAAARAVGVELRVDSGKSLAESLDDANVPGRPTFNKLLRILTTRCMLQAAYFPSGQCPPAEYFHYGLAAPIYTHFTSPIRRYADVIVHRLLAAALDVDPLPAAYQDRAHMTALAANMNKRHLMSQMAGRSSSSLHTNIFFRNRVILETGLILKLRANGVVILVPRFALEKMVILSRAPKPGSSANPVGAASAEASRILNFDEANQVIVDAADPALRLGIFDEVTVALFVEERIRGRKELVMRIISPAFHAFDRSALAADIIVEDRSGANPTTVVPAGSKRTAQPAEQKPTKKSK